MLRQLIFCSTILLWCCVPVKTEAQKTDSVPRQRFDSVVKLTDSLRKTDSATRVAQRIKDSSARALDSINKSAALAKCNCIPNQNGKVEPMAWILVLLPAVLLCVLLWLFMSYGLAAFNLSQAMSENSYPTIRVDNPQYTPDNLTNAALVAKENMEDIIPPTIEKTYLIATNTGTPPNVVTALAPPPPNPSVSRYIAFITSILTLVVALGVSCFYIYHYVRTGCPPELTGISTLLIALGIGVLPYIFNKMAGAIGKSKDDSI